MDTNLVGRFCRGYSRRSRRLQLFICVLVYISVLSVKHPTGPQDFAIATGHGKCLVWVYADAGVAALHVSGATVPLFGIAIYGRADKLD